MEKQRHEKAARNMLRSKSPFEEINSGTKLLNQKRISQEGAKKTIRQKIEEKIEGINYEAMY